MPLSACSHADSAGHRGLLTDSAPAARGYQPFRSAGPAAPGITYQAGVNTFAIHLCYLK